MLFKDALKKSRGVEEVSALNESSDKELTAAMAILKPGVYEVHEWIFMYYNGKENKTTQVVVTEQGVEVKNPEQPLKPSTVALDLSKVKTNSDNMIKKAVDEFKKYKKPLSQVIINLTQEEKPVWRFSFITKSLEVVTIKINAETGEVLDKKIQALTK